MSDKVDIRLDPGIKPTDPIHCHLQFDRELVGHDAEFEIVVEVNVNDSSPVHSESRLYYQKFNITSTIKVIEIPRAKIRAFDYEGEKISIEVHTRLKIDDGMLFDTKVSQKQQMDIGIKPKIKEDAVEKIEPKDIFNFFKNLQAIPAKSQLVTLLLALAGGIIMIVNALIGIHDQFVPESMTYLYSHYDSDGEGQSPLINSLMGSGALGMAVWFAMRNQLRKYMKFNLNMINLPKRIEPEKSYSASKFFSGISRVPLTNITLRIIACNMEKGQYVRGSGSNRRTVSFAEPIRGVILFEKTVNQIPANVKIRHFFSEKFSFKSMFECLYPPFMATDTHGIDVHWEIQLIHPEFIDQELIGMTNIFHYDDFLKG